MSDVDTSLTRFQSVPFLVEVELGRLALDLESILRLQEGDVLRMDTAVGEPLRVLAGGVEVGFSDLVTMEDQIAARMTRITHPPAPGRLNGNS